MLVIDYPEPRFNMKKEGDKDLIFDAIRKRWLVLTPEEWVRQNFIQYLVQVKRYPATLIAMEKVIALGELKKRFDILVYDQEHRPWMMVECKASSVVLGQETLHQLLRYHISVPTGFLVITNGQSSYGWKKYEGGLVLLNELPAWEER